tara:strand:- start:433 stop:1047 length:615 start_codon:yes stop_codon:yes gene_type:complete
MKITQSQLKQIIEEEVKSTLQEGYLSTLFKLIDFAFAPKDEKEARQERNRIMSTWSEEDNEKWFNEFWPKVSNELKQITADRINDPNYQSKVQKQRKHLANALEDFSVEHTAGRESDRLQRRDAEKKQADADLSDKQVQLTRDRERAYQTTGGKKEYDRMVRKAKRRIQLKQGTEEDELLASINEKKLKQFIREELEDALRNIK